VIHEGTKQVGQHSQKRLKEENIMTQLGKYELHEQLGKGGFGTVYRATDTVLDVERAVKVLHPLLVADTAFVSRFRQEAQLAAKLEHANLVPVYDFGEIEGRFFLVMKYMPGGSLGDLLKKEGKLEEETAIRIFSQAAEGLGYAHAKGIVHRDLKPSNILFDQDGNVRISDLGFAKSMDGGSRSSMSTSGMMVGTPSYMAPEIWKGKPASPASDIYSMGCILYEMLTGKVLFAGDSPADIMTRHVLEGPEYKGLVSHEQERVLSTALGKDAGERFHSVSQFVDSLRLSAHNDKSPDNVVHAPHHVLERQTEDAALEQKKAEPLEEPEIRTARIDTKKEEPPISDIKQFSEPFLYRDASGKICIGWNSMGMSYLLILTGWIVGISVAYWTYYRYFVLQDIYGDYYSGQILGGIFAGGIIGFFIWLSLRKIFHFTKRQLLLSIIFLAFSFYMISTTVLWVW